MALTTNEMANFDELSVDKRVEGKYKLHSNSHEVRLYLHSACYYSFNVCYRMGRICSFDFHTSFLLLGFYKICYSVYLEIC